MILLLLIGGYVVVELIALSGNLDDLLSGKERDMYVTVESDLDEG